MKILRKKTNLHFVQDLSTSHDWSPRLYVYMRRRRKRNSGDKKTKKNLSKEEKEERER